MNTYSVLFANNEAFHDTIDGLDSPLSQYDVVATFKKEDFHGEDFEEMYSRCQNITEGWNKENPCRSMSIGDLIRDDDKGLYWRVARIGFESYFPVE